MTATSTNTRAPICIACMRSDAYQTLQDQRDRAVQALQVTLQDSGSVQAQIASLTSQLSTKVGELDTAQTALAQKTSAYNTVAMQLYTASASLATCQQDLQAMTNARDAAVATRDTANAQLSTLQSNLATATSQLSTAQQQVATLSAQVADLSAQLATKTAQYNALLVDEPAAYALITARLPANFNGFGKDALTSNWLASTKPNILTTIVGSGATLYLALQNLRTKL